MREKILYEFSIIRIVPRVEREEFINAGILIYSKPARKLLVKTFFDEKKWALFETELTEEEVRLNLKSFELIAQGTGEGGPIARLDLASRFRWMTAVRSSCIQTSRSHPGFSKNLEETLERLFRELML